MYIYMCLAIRRSNLLQSSSNTSLLATAKVKKKGLLIPWGCSLPAIGRFNFTTCSSNGTEAER